MCIRVHAGTNAHGRKLSPLQEDLYFSCLRALKLPGPQVPQANRCRRGLLATPSLGTTSYLLNSMPLTPLEDKLQYRVSGHFRVGVRQGGALLSEGALIAEGKEVSGLYLDTEQCPAGSPFSPVSCGLLLPGATSRGDSLLKESVIFSRLSQSSAESQSQGQWA